MPILSTDSVLVSSRGRRVRVAGLPDFNDLDFNFVMEDVEGWDGASGLRTELVANGGGPGSVAAGDWVATEEYLTLVGVLGSDNPADVTQFRAALLAALPPNRESSLIMLGGDWDVDKQMFVRRYDRMEAERYRDWMRFTIPVVAPDPFKYSLEALSGSMGVFSGVDWYRTYVDDGAGVWSRVYINEGGRWLRTYQRNNVIGEYPLALGLESPGDATSSHVTVEIVGPLPTGWWVERQDADGVIVEQAWAETELTSGQNLVMDTHTRSAQLDGADVSHLMFGDFLRLPPGPSTFRLVAPSDSGGHATVTALPAYL